jgi:hypothetical protein
MQRLFAKDTEWKTPWMMQVLPNLIILAAADPAQTIFSASFQPARPGDGHGAWARYWKR